MDREYSLWILPPAQAELEETARIHLALSGPQSAWDITDKDGWGDGTADPFPAVRPPVRDGQLGVAGYRYLFAGKYLPIDRLLGDAGVVYHIAHSATGYPTLCRTSVF